MGLATDTVPSDLPLGGPDCNRHREEMVEDINGSAFEIPPPLPTTSPPASPRLSPSSPSTSKRKSTTNGINNAAGGGNSNNLRQLKTVELLESVPGRNRKGEEEDGELVSNLRSELEATKLECKRLAQIRVC